MASASSINRLGFTVVGEVQSDPIAVLVFVHGLRGDPRYTWSKNSQTSAANTKSSSRWRRVFRWGSSSDRSRPSLSRSGTEFCWPRDDLPKRLPKNVQILLYGYEADAIGPFQVKSQNTITTHGNNFLVALERRIPKGTPIIFVAHSLGGILVKDALVISKAHVIPKFRSIHSDTRMVVFMGTPHRGSEMAGLATTMANITKVALQVPNKSLLRGLEKGSEVLDRIHTAFMQLLAKPDFAIHCFQEDRGITLIPGLTGLVVDAQSSKTGSPHETTETVAANHMDLVAFTGPDDHNYRQVAEALVSFVSDIVSSNTPQGAKNDGQVLPRMISSHERERPRKLKKLFEVPFSRNSRFCGRGEVLTILHDLLDKGHGQSAARQLRSCVIHGMGGVGKTQVALEYTYSYRDSYDFIFWINAENEAVLLTSVSKIMSSLSFGLADGTANSAVIMESFRKWLEETSKLSPAIHLLPYVCKPWLLVFDNVEAPSILQPCWPRSNHGAILITSRHDELAPVATEDIHLEPFSSAEGSQFILKHLPKGGIHYEEGVAKKISAQLGGLPLVLGFASGYISKTKWSLEEFSKYYEKRQISASIFAMDPPTTTHQYERSITMAWEASLSNLEPVQLKIVQILSMLSPDGVPEGILFADHKEQDLAFLRTSNTSIQFFSTMIGELASQHLVSRETIAQKPQLLIHRSLQKSVLHSLDREPHLLQHTFNLAFTLIRKVYPKQSPTHDPQNQHWQTQELYQPHILSLHTTYKQSEACQLSASIGFAELLSDAVYYLFERGMHTDSLKLSDTAEDICRKCPDASYISRANIYSLAVAVRWNRGISHRAALLHRVLKGLALLHKHINELDPNDATSEVLRLYATSWNDIGAILMDYECYEDALECLDLCESIKGCLGDRLGVLGAARNRSLALVWLGRFGEAVDLVPDESDVLPELLAPECVSYYGRCRYAWGNVLMMAGKTGRAESLLQKELHSRKLLFGETGHYTLDAYYLLGVTYRKMGNFKQAIKYFRTALENSVNWPEEAKCITKYHLSKALVDIGQIDEAKSLVAESEATRLSFWNDYVDYLPTNGAHDDGSYDHIASVEFGRVAVSKYPSVGKLPKLMETCRDIQARFNALGNQHALHTGTQVIVVYLSSHAMPSSQSRVPEASEERKQPWRAVVSQGDQMKAGEDENAKANEKEEFVKGSVVVNEGSSPSMAA
ncbi:hypothetical protein BDV06DRAFT_226681 [Aspergillus oleicola]